jgi:hypothetical protein
MVSGNSAADQEATTKALLVGFGYMEEATQPCLLKPIAEYLSMVDVGLGKVGSTMVDVSYADKAHILTFCELVALDGCTIPFLYSAFVTSKEGAYQVDDADFVCLIEQEKFAEGLTRMHPMDYVSDLKLFAIESVESADLTPAPSGSDLEELQAALDMFGLEALPKSRYEA